MRRTIPRIRAVVFYLTPCGIESMRCMMEWCFRIVAPGP